MATLTLTQANTIISAAFKHAEKLSLAPLTVVVLDPGGHMIALQRQDGSSILRCEIATGKAFGALALGLGSRKVSAMAIERPHFLEGLSGVSGGRIVPVPGGVLVRDSEGAIIGAVGITGDTSDNDEACAIAGIEAADLTADGG
ncbi:GlcG/HbpS family heme-binding protein [Pseudohoeflea coraliihabitans]|uniref:Heme-binding protein n=1 Tax=Pseudohoeflea coraliihabitans TaxID=2860393 RepID=A0ABS6WNA9_9HYPH|nr:heme-binding protein [Pseudohoeflea sp. DP4N28-3]